MENNHIVKKVFKFIINAVAWIILIFALLITVLVFTSDRNNGGEPAGIYSANSRIGFYEPDIQQK